MPDPAIEARRAALADLGAAFRTALVALVETDAPVEDLRRGTELARSLATTVLGEPRPVTEVASVDDISRTIRYFSPTVGAANPMAPPITIEDTPTGVRCTVTLDRRFEGPPGFVHGGVTSLLLDEVLGSAATHRGHWGMTAYLHVTYRRALPLDTELVFDARLDRVDGRKILVVGQVAIASAPEVRCVDAEALFVEPRPETRARYFGDLTDADGASTSATFGR